MVGSGRSWPLPADGWPTVSFLHHARDMIVSDQEGWYGMWNPKRMDIWEEMSGMTWMQHWLKGSRPETAAMTGKQGRC
jgi:hypothetical protein